MTWFENGKSRIKKHEASMLNFGPVQFRFTSNQKNIVGFNMAMSKTRLAKSIMDINSVNISMSRII